MLPYGKITLLQGDPGDGKSTFMLHLVARITTKGKLPDGKMFPECQNVIYQCSEDSPSDTIKPRLECMQPDFDNIYIFDESEKGLSLSDDTRIEKIMKDLHKDNYQILKRRMIHISSTYIREHLDDYEAIKDMIDKKVYQYLIKMERS